MNATQQLLCAPLEQILVSGGDTRSTVDAQTGLNSFGCTPAPRPEALSFGSSTATSISVRAFRHVEKERCQVLERPCHRDVLEEPTEGLRSELKHLLGLNQTGMEIVFSPSGTDSTLHALFVARALHGMAPLDCIVLASDETGSGVPNALAGRHFSTITAEGVAVPKGEPIAGLSENVTLLSVPMRSLEGILRSPASIEQEVFDRVSRSVAAGRKVLLQVMDSSKFGVRCPGSDCLRSLQSHFGNSVLIVVDACQMRLSRARLQGHLAQGHLVLISGSKFFTGPPFSGALLVPAALAAQIATLREVPPGLQDYTNRAAWPRAWKSLRAALPDRANFGPYFRWAAALCEMRAYFSIPPGFRCAALRRFAELVTTQLCERSPDLFLLEEWEAFTEAEEAEDAEMDARTIFPFLLRQSGAWMTFAETTALYTSLNQDCTARLPVSLSPQEKALAAQLCHIGQPVRVSRGGGQITGALRLCASARTVSQVWGRYQTDPLAIDLDQEHQEIETILDKTALLSRHITSLTESAL